MEMCSLGTVARTAPFETTRSWGHLSEVDTPFSEIPVSSVALQHLNRHRRLRFQQDFLPGLPLIGNRINSSGVSITSTGTADNALHSSNVSDFTTLSVGSA
jgi:hypothetical protein